VDVAKKKYHLIIFDLPNYINDMYLGVMDIADIMVLVSDCTIGSIGRLININKKFIYDDLEKILVINKSNNDSEIIFNKSQLRQFFNLEEFILIDENKQLKGRSNFGNFNFDSLKDINCFVDKVLDLLTYD
jgi:Flp pilus assembly CpaE family ATPase